MKKIIAPILFVTSMIVLSGCSLTGEKEDAMKLEGMIPKEDNKTINSMMEKDDSMMEKQGDAMMKKDAPEIEGSYAVYSEAAVESALASGKKVALFFHAPWCPSCKSADTNLSHEKLSPDTIVFKTDYDSNVELKKKYGVTYQHTFVSLKSDGTLLKKASGLSTATEIAELF